MRNRPVPPLQPDGEETALRTPPGARHFFIDRAGTFLSISLDQLAVAGYAVADLATLTFFQLVHPLDAATVKAAVKTPGRQCAFRFLCKDDRWLRVTASFQPAGSAGTNCYAVLMQPCEKKPLAANGQNSDNGDSIYSQFFYDHPLPMFVADAATLDLLDLNRSAVHEYGYSREQLLCMNLDDLRVKDDGADLRVHLVTASFLQREDVLRKKDGTEVDVEVVAHKIWHDGREVWMSTVHDISERKKAERERAASELRYRTFIEQSVSGIWRFDLHKPMPLHYTRKQVIEHFYENCYLAECNDAMAQMYGLQKKEELIGKDCEFFLPRNEPSSLRFFHDFIDQQFKVKNSVSYESDIHGRAKVFLNNYSAHIENGHIVHTWGTQMDITQQKADEESIEYLACIVENAADAIYSTGIDREVITWNKACEKLTGVRAVDIKGQSLRAFFYFRCISGGLKEVNRVLNEQGSWKGEVVLQHKTTGAVLNVLAYVVAQHDTAGDINRLLVFCRDISENKRAESLLKESEERFINLAERAPAMIYMIDEKDRPFYFNREWLRFTGRTLEEEIRVDPIPDIHPEELEKVRRAYYTNTMARRQFEVEYRRRNYRGEWRWIIDRCMPRFLKDGAYIGYISFCFDIHERKKAEDESRRRAVQLSGMINGITDGFLAADNNFIITMCNREAERLFAMKPLNIIGKPLHVVFKPYKSRPLAKPLNEALLQKRPFRFEEYIEQTGYWLEASVYPYRDGFFVYFKDTTSRRRREMLLEVQKRLLEADTVMEITWENLADILNRGILKIFPGTLNVFCRADEATGLFKTVLTPVMPEEIRAFLSNLQTGVPLSIHQVENSRATQFIPDIQKEAYLAPFHQLAKQLGIQSAVVVPIVSAANNVLGVVTVYYPTCPTMQQEDTEILQQLVSVFSAVIEKKAAKQKQKELEKNLADEKLQQQKRMNEALLEGIEKQRLEMSRELHDNVCQVLASAKLLMEMAIAENQIQSPRARQGIGYVMDGINEIRRLSHELAPPGLRRLSLTEAIREHTGSLQQLNGINVSFTTSLNGSARDLPEEVQLALYRIVQEQTNNIRKYAKAKNITIALGKTGDALSLVVEDDGVGFDLQKVSGGLGLINIVSRASILQGKAEFKTAPGRGCRLEVAIPLVAKG